MSCSRSAHLGWRSLQRSDWGAGWRCKEAKTFFFSAEGAAGAGGDLTDANDIFARAESACAKTGDITTARDGRLQTRHGAQIGASGFATFNEAGNSAAEVDQIFLAGDGAATVTGI